MAADVEANLPSTLVEGVYDAVADPDRWPSALAAITGRFGGVLAMLSVADTRAGRARFRASHGDPQVLAPLLADEAAGLPFYAGLDRMEIDTPVTLDMLYALQGAGARQSWLQSRLNLDWAQPNRLDDFFWVALMKQPARVGSLIVITGRDRPRIAPEDLERFARLAPHLRRAVVIGDLIEAERARSAALAAVIDALACPVLVVARDLRLLHANPAAEARLATGGALGLVQGRLVPGWAPAAQAIARAVEQGVRAEAELGPAGIGVPLARAPRPAVAHVLPLARRDPAHRPEPAAAAAVFVAQAGSVPLPAMQAVAALFGLTAAETRVATLIAQGLDRAEIAVAHAVSDGTVKAQLAAIYDKTGTGDKRALSLLVRELTPPLRDGD